MITLRNAYYCNLKLFLIFLVILGHAIEPGIGANPTLYRLYQTIYLFHIPLFCFVSGIFMKTPTGCIRQLRRLLPVYLGCQAIAVIPGLAKWHTPWWILWYLWSMCIWLALSAVLMKQSHRWRILLLAIVLGCLVGRANWIGRWMSLSRTIVFFPYFWLGTLIPTDFSWNRFRIPALWALLLIGVRVPVVTLYHAGPCAPLTRLYCYGCAAALSLLVLSWCPGRRFPWTKAGADTMPAYLLHAPLLRLLPTNHPLLFTVLFLCFITKAICWHNAIGIIGKEECPWPDLKICTKPRENQSTGSFWP